MDYSGFALGEYLDKQQYPYKVHSSGSHSEYAICCPECKNRGEPRDDTKFRLWINTENGLFHCYNCYWSGTLLHFVQKTSGVDLRNAIKLLRGKKVDLMNSMSFRLSDNEPEMEENVTAIKEIEYPYGYEPIEEPHSYLQKRGIPLEYARKNDWGSAKIGFCANRIIVPTHMQDRLVFWQARATFEDSSADFKKVLNPSGVSAKPVLYQYDSAKKFEEVILAEGFMDAAKIGPDAMATNGKRLHMPQVEWLAEAGVKSVVLMWDRDAWEDRRERKGVVTPCSIERAADMLKVMFEVKAVRMPDQRDPGDYPFQSGELRNLIVKAEKI